jgi:hypothetical protein
MIDIENIVFTAVSNAVKAEYPNAAIYGEYVEAPADFPCVCISEDDNYSYGSTQDNALEDNNVGVMYSVNIFTSNQVGKKTEAKKIAKIVDSVLLGFKMSRTALLPVPSPTSLSPARLLPREHLKYLSDLQTVPKVFRYMKHLRPTISLSV